MNDLEGLEHCVEIFHSRIFQCLCVKSNEQNFNEQNSCVNKCLATQISLTYCYLFFQKLGFLLWKCHIYLPKCREVGILTLLDYFTFYTLLLVKIMSSGNI